MRRTKEETIKFFKEEFLKDRTPEFIKKFEDKDISKQYVAVMNWKRSIKKQEGETTGELKYTIYNILSYLKKANFEIEHILNLTPKEAAKALELIDKIRLNIINFDKIKKQRVLDDLLKQEEKLEKDRDYLRKKITSIQQELS